MIRRRFRPVPKKFAVRLTLTNAAFEAVEAPGRRSELPRAVSGPRGLPSRDDLLDQIHDSVVCTDLDGFITDWNKGAERLFGYSASEMLGQHISTVYFSEDHGFLETEVIAPLKARGRHDLEVRMRRRAGEPFYAHLLLALITDESGTPIGMIGCSKDITDRKSAEMAVARRLRQQHATTLFAQWALELSERSFDGGIQQLLDEAVRVVARTLDAPCAKVLELLPDGRNLLLRAGAGWNSGLVGHTLVGAGVESQAGYTLLAGAPVVVQDFAREHRFTQPELLRSHGLVSGISTQVVTGGRAYGVLGVHDRTPRSFSDDDAAFVSAIANIIGLAMSHYRLTESLIERGDRFDQVAENLREVLYMLDAATGEVLYVNPAYETVWGLTRGTLHQDPASWLQAIHPDDRTRIAQALTNLSSFSEEFRIIRPDGEMRWIRDQVFPVHDGRGQVHRFVGLAQDVTEERRLAIERERRAEEHAARVAAEAAVRARDEALGRVAHDLRNPLTVVVGSATELTRGGTSPHQVPAIASRILRSVDRMDRLVHDLLDVARLEAGRLVIDIADVDTRAVIEEAYDAVRARAEEQHVRLVLACEPSVAPIAGDRRRLLQVLINLLENGIKFTPAGGTITIRARSAGSMVQLSVSDTGRGIPPGHLEKLFTPFWQATAADHRGAGLGLAIVKALVEAHGGRVWAESACDVGSTFHVMLPAQLPGGHDAAAGAEHSRT